MFEPQKLHRHLYLQLNQQKKENLISHVLLYRCYKSYHRSQGLLMACLLAQLQFLPEVLFYTLNLPSVIRSICCSNLFILSIKASIDFSRSFKARRIDLCFLNLLLSVSCTTPVLVSFTRVSFSTLTFINYPMQ